MNKKQREAKRKNAQQHLKKVRVMAEERAACRNTPEYQQEQARRKHYYATRTPIMADEPKPTIQSTAFFNQWVGAAGAVETLLGIGQLVPRDARKDIEEREKEFALEGEFHVVDENVKQLN